MVTVTRPAVRQAVLGAMRGADVARPELGEVGRQAVEGAIVGAASVGIDSVKASTAAVEGVVEGVIEAGADPAEAARATVGGVVSGVSTAGGDVATAAREATHALMSHDAVADLDTNDAVIVAESVVDAALLQPENSAVSKEELVAAAATGLVEAAYQAGQVQGDRVRHSVIKRLLKHVHEVAPHLKHGIAEAAERLSDELPRGRATWRGAAMLRAARLVLDAGGIDLAASISYFTILSLLPLVALVIMTVGAFGDPESVTREITEILVYYFPSSGDLIHEALDNLLRGSIAFGLIALVSIVLGANGLLLAADRAINRIFGTENRGIFRTTLVQVAVATLVVVLFLLSVGLTALFQIFVNFNAGIVESTGGISAIIAVALGAISTVLPAMLTAALFTVVYYHLPNISVEWRDAVFGAMIAIVLFEIGKHAFFWFTGLATHRIAVYGPVASAVIFMTWAYIAAVIFLYGAALTKMAGELRPRTT